MELAIQELTTGLDLITELWFVVDDQVELCEDVKRAIEAGLAFLKSTEESTVAEADSSVSSVQAAGKGAKRPRSEYLSARDQAKRRKHCPKRLITYSPFGDGYQWRKYGQKNIRNAEHPRCYYRCTYSGCNARKQVQQKTSDYPPEYEVIFTDEHTCNCTAKLSREQEIITFDSNETNPGVNDRTTTSSVNMSLLHLLTSDKFDDGLDILDYPMSPAGQFYGSDASANYNVEQPFEPFVTHF